MISKMNLQDLDDVLESLLDTESRLKRLAVEIRINHGDGNPADWLTLSKSHVSHAINELIMACRDESFANARKANTSNVWTKFKALKWSL